MSWEYKTLDQLGEVSRGRSRHRPRNDPSLFGGKYPFIQTADVKAANFYITEYDTTYNEKGLAQSKLWKPGTLCITIAANIADIHSSRVHRSVRRFDLAVDIPIDRASVRLVKDRRVYSERRHGEEWTEYLGPKASTVGRCKLYNKTAEAKLSYPLTRLELTLDPEIPYEEIAWPKVYYIDNRQVEFDELQALTDTQRFILGALMEGYGSLNDLGRRTKEKLLAYMEGYCRWVTVSKTDYEKILYQLKTYLEYPDLPLSIEHITADQPPRSKDSLPFWVLEAEHGPIDSLII